MIDAVKLEPFNRNGIRDSTTLMDIMTTTIGMYISTTEGNAPSDLSLKGMISLIDPPTTENIMELAELFRDLYRDEDFLVFFFD